MKKIITIITIIGISLCLVMVFSGCAGKIAQKTIEKAIENAAAKEGENVDIDLSEGQVNITDEEGNEMSIGGSDIPDDWPSVVPVNKDITITFSASQTTDGKKGWSVSGTYSGSGEELYNYYKSELSGWNEVSDVKMDAGDDGQNYTYQASNDTYLTTVFINDAADVNVVLSVTEE